MTKKHKYFTAQLLQWHSQHNDRILPWKGISDPYKIWLSEVMLQQTRAEQGLPYYHSFTTNYPDIIALANASDDAVFKLWQGLGYYNRCRNMLQTARFIATELGGKFPDNYADILALKGVGTYTAAAIASFAFGLPHAVVDGNVYRVLSRYFGIDDAIDGAAGKVKFAQLADELLCRKNPALYNQAIMDLGASVCTPKKAQCADCPLSKHCVALKDNLVSLLPFKEKKLKIKNRFFNFIVLQFHDEVWITQRNKKDVWQDLYQFLLIETASDLYIEDLQLQPMLYQILDKKQTLVFTKQIKQRLTHQLIESKFFTVSFEKKPTNMTQDGMWVKLSDINNYAFPKTIIQFIDERLTG
ncbi:MAG: A/G-specific adenine glycosylase [Chitinophagaceae bacterium]|nr:A/G-specific adenine glycosylase [Chitinophagaceae bacterium]